MEKSDATYEDSESEEDSEGFDASEVEDADRVISREQDAA